MNAQKPLALVTGASSGIGLELARQFAENGYDLIIAAENAGIDTARDQLSSTGANVRAIRVDLRNKEEVERLYQEASAGRTINAAAINAGIGVNGAFTDTDLQEEFDVIALNVNSTVHLAKLLLKDMKARNAGKILFTASVVSTIPTPYQAIYSASKAFILNFAEAIREELKETDITITSLMPGATDTNFFARAGMEDTIVGQSKKDDPADVARDGFKALMAGENKVVAHSFISKTQGLMGNILPDAANAKVIGKMSKPDRRESKLYTEG